MDRGRFESLGVPDNGVSYPSRRRATRPTSIFGLRDDSKADPGEEPSPDSFSFFSLSLSLSLYLYFFLSFYFRGLGKTVFY